MGYGETEGSTDFQGRDEETSSYLSVGFGMGDNTETNTDEGSSSWSVEGSYYERDRQQITRATVGCWQYHGEQ
ncbi:hypothetical protein [Marinibactrum halimedae]|uniref:Uncharacterized protein n=1 Tax=Marinibactrum halimedae TaxID=1444977 RepID=A0AA37T9E1_9GAMM|nr:hypothetical protein [Marinibactrum halimedae]MCD9460859.1 hypothetical protein [Marinibactrum halimedae]GLS27362.1 hypothetical protein GCM10007877_30810 [Marinibactrum halimedae]